MIRSIYVRRVGFNLKNVAINVAHVKSLQRVPYPNHFYWQLHYFIAMGLLQMAKLGTKLVLAGGAVYYSNEFGVWGNTKETEEGYANLKAAVKVCIIDWNTIYKFLL